MSKHTIMAFGIGGDIAEALDCGLWEKIFITTKKDLNKIESALKRWDEDYGSDSVIYIPKYKKHIVAENITDKQLEKFNLKSSWEILDIIFRCSGMEWYYQKDLMVYFTASKYIIKYVDTWNKQGNKRWWNDFKEELEEAKYNPRNVLGKLEFDRRAEADGIVWKDEE